jgi:hypothetical protein
MIAHEIAGIASRSKVPEKVLPVVNGFNKVPEEGSVFGQFDETGIVSLPSSRMCSRCQRVIVYRDLLAQVSS